MSVIPPLQVNGSPASIPSIAQVPSRRLLVVRHRLPCQYCTPAPEGATLGPTRKRTNAPAAKCRRELYQSGAIAKSLRYPPGDFGPSGNGYGTPPPVIQILGPGILAPSGNGNGTPLVTVTVTTRQKILKTSICPSKTPKFSSRFARNGTPPGQIKR